jgi:hypothetical protein
MTVPHLEPRKRARRGRLGPFPGCTSKLDRRTREAKLLVATRAELTAHVGGNPNPVQRALIERAARLTVYIKAMDHEALESGTMSERNSRQYLAWVGALRVGALPGLNIGAL